MVTCMYQVPVRCQALNFLNLVILLGLADGTEQMLQQRTGEINQSLI